MCKKRKSPTAKQGIPDKQRNEVTKKILTKEEILRNANIQRGRLVIAINEAATPKSMRQLSNITGIEIPTICRRLDELQKLGLVILAYYDACPITRYPKVGYYQKGGRNAG